MCKHYDYVLTEEHRHHVVSEEHDNCLLCLVEDKAPMTQEAVAQYLGVSKVFISQIEKTALRKLKKAMKLRIEDIPTGFDLDHKHGINFNMKAAIAEDFNAE